jgi:hypothetical protein
MVELDDRKVDTKVVCTSPEVQLDQLVDTKANFHPGRFASG